jgi:hypothetical protein
VAKKLRFDQRRRQGRQVQWVKQGREVLPELPLAVQGDIHRTADGLGHQLLARARGAGDQGRKVLHVLEERAAPATQVMRDDGLPDGPAQAGHRGGGAHQVPVDVVERPAQLEKAGKEVGRVVAGGKTQGREWEPVLEALAKLLPQVGIGRFLPALDRCLNSLVQPCPGIEVIQGQVLVQAQILCRCGYAARQALPQPAQQFVGPVGETAQVGVVVLRPPLRPPAVDGRSLLVLFSQQLPLFFDPLRQEGVGVHQLGKPLGKAPLGRLEQLHRSFLRGVCLCLRAGPS